MSTDYVSYDPIPFEDMKKLRGKIRPSKPDPEGTGVNSVCLTDGKNCVWAYRQGHGTTFTRFGGNSVDDMLELIASKYDTGFTSEYDDDFARVLRHQGGSVRKKKK